MQRSDLEKSVSYQAEARDMENPGKIYYKAPYIFINEKYKGIHVINNSKPENPVKEGFIVAPGCIDMAIKENVLFLDNATDLVAFDLTTKQVTKRIRKMFPEPLSPENETFSSEENREDYVLVGWKKNPNKN
jgi:glutaredoxin